jgi:pimeloyl-ACP methyl ester carboxylesterase
MFLMTKTDKERVVLLHGILNPRWVMWPLARRLRREGFEPMVWAFPGSRRYIEELSQSLGKFVNSIPGNAPIHFAGFSLGSLVARHYLSTAPPRRAGRFVMIGPPNHGCQKAQDLYRFAWFRWLYGHHAIRQMFPGSDFFRSIGIPKVEVGVIAGEGFSALASLAHGLTFQRSRL